MKIIHDLPQGSTRWLEYRAGIPTASEFDALISPKWEIRTGEMPKTYLARKLAEWWFGPLQGRGGSSSFAAEQGTILEEEAIPWFEFQHGVKIDRVGFITNDDGTAGCSPDGLLGDDCGIEVKCPEPQTHIKYLLHGGLPPEYAAQVHGSMFITGRPMWKFVSYRRGLPPLILDIPRDEKVMACFSEALDLFKFKFDEAKKRIIELNGGPPPVREPMVFADELSPSDAEYRD